MSLLESLTVGLEDVGTAPQNYILNVNQTVSEVAKFFFG